MNDTSEEIALEASDRRLSIVREARDPKGQWRPIEYLPSSWCGNSHHRVFLPAGYFWSFAAPEYGGSFRTRMRFVLSRKEGLLHSNEFDGWINLDQFEKRLGHVPNGIMDPYRDCSAAPTQFALFRSRLNLTGNWTERAIFGRSPELHNSKQTG